LVALFHRPTPTIAAQTMDLVIKPDTLNNSLEALWLAFEIRDSKKYGIFPKE
jgi:hypothetical protein